MSVARPQLTVYSLSGQTSTSNVVAPAVFKAPIRTDIVHSVWTGVAKNKRQAYAVASNAGEQTSAESWGTGRAVARIPRVGGGGTHRSGQAAFGNMCRGGRLFAPTKVWRKWHVKIPQNQKRYATASAIAASTVAPLVIARGHRAENVPEVPLVVSSELETLSKTKEAVAALKAIGAGADVARVIKSKTLRAGQGKLRGRRYTQRKGPLVVYAEDKGLVKAFKNIPGVETANVKSLNLLQLAPGSHVGRFVIWTESAVALLDDIWASKSGFSIPKDIISNSDIKSILESSEIQSVLRPARKNELRRAAPKNPLKNKEALLKLNPYAGVKKTSKVDKKSVATHKSLVEILNQE